MTNFTEWGIAVKKRMIDLGMTQKELAEAVSKETGLFVDGGYLYKILTGRRAAPKVVSAINSVLGIE